MPKLIYAPKQFEQKDRKSIKNEWAGSVVVADPLTMPQVREIEKVLSATIEDKSGTGRVFLSVVDESMLPAVLACVTKWDLQNFPVDVMPENFPMSPRAASHELIKWLFGEIYKVYIGEIEIPNG